MLRVLITILICLGLASPAVASKSWNGSAWVDTTAKRWDGDSWETIVEKRWDGDSWEIISGGGAPACGSLVFSGSPGDAETFENADGSFCTDGFAETDPASIINTYSTTQYKDVAHSTYFGFIGAESNINYLRSDLGVGDTNFTLSYWLRVGSQAAWSNELIFIMSQHATAPYNSNDNAFQVMVSDQNGGTQFKIRAYTYSAGTSVLGSVNYAVGSWIKLVFEFNSGATSNLKIYNTAESLQETITVTAPARTLRYFYWGEITSTAQTTIRPFYIDGVQYNSTNP